MARYDDDRHICHWYHLLQEVREGALELGFSSMKEIEVDDEMLLELKRFDPDRVVEMEQLVALQIFAEGLKKGFTDNALDVPEWLLDKLDTVKSEIHTRRKNAIRAAIKEAEARVASYKTASEKRADAQAELDKLKALVQP